MDLALTAEQSALVASVAELLGAHSSLDVVREAEDSGFDPALWSLLQEFGVVAMAVPEANDGWGADLLDLCLVAEQVGAALSPAPVVETQVATRLLAGIEHDLAAAHLARAVAGEEIVTLAVRPARSGVATLVPAAAVADCAIVLDRDRLVLVPLSDSNRRPVANLAAAPLADIDLVNATEIAAGAGALAGYERAIDEWLVLTAAQLIGSATVAHRMTCEYAVDRHTWGSPIGTYQAVSHPLADSATALDGGRLLVRKAAWALDAGNSRGRELAAMAFAFASETARDATYLAVHLHGGVGFTLEHAAQFHYRRVRGWARVWGEPRQAHLRVAAQRYASPTPVGSTV
jgi:alkylation response protein AidB-like acyl-CoA dehydrogenase